MIQGAGLDCSTRPTRCLGSGKAVACHRTSGSADPSATESVDLGRCLLTNVDSAAEVLAVTESESFR
jgi:hypothetical protein